MGTFLEIGLSNAVVAIPLALLAAVVSRLCRRPALAHAMWLLVLLKLVAPPLYRVPMPWLPAPKLSTGPGCPSSVEESTVNSWQAAEPSPEVPGNLFELSGLSERDLTFSSSGLVPLESPPDLGQPAFSPTRPLNWTESLALVASAWVEIVAWTWLASSLLWFAWTGLQVYRFQRLLQFAKRAPQALQDEVERLAARLGLTRAPAVWLVPGAVSPMLWPVGQYPRLLFPARLLNQLDRLQRDTLFVHELAHYRRRDHWVRLLETLVLALYWWHPIVWCARRELREAEE